MLATMRSAFVAIVTSAALCGLLGGCANYPPAPEVVGPGVPAADLPGELAEIRVFTLKTWGQSGRRDFPIRFERTDGTLKGYIGNHATSRQSWEVPLKNLRIDGNSIIRFDFERPAEGTFPLELARQDRGTYLGKMSGVSMGYSWSVPADILKAGS